MTGPTAPPQTKRHLYLGQRGGATLFELVIVSAILALLAAILLNRVVWHQQQAEMAGAQQVVVALRSALRLQAAMLLARGGGEQALAVLALQNPMGWLARTPANYAGEYDAPDVQVLPRGFWYYDKINKTLIYLPISEKNVSHGSVNLMRFKVKLSPAISAPGRHQTPITPGRIVLEQITA